MENALKTLKELIGKLECQKDELKESVDDLQSRLETIENEIAIFTDRTEHLESLLENECVDVVDVIANLKEAM